MKKSIYSIRDRNTCHQIIFLAYNDADAKRTFRAEANNPQSQLCIFAPDFELYKLADFNESTGKITNCEPEFLVSALQMKEEKNNDIQVAD